MGDSAVHVRRQRGSAFSLIDASGELDEKRKGGMHPVAGYQIAFSGGKGPNEGVRLQQLLDGLFYLRQIGITEER